VNNFIKNKGLDVNYFTIIVGFFIFSWTAYNALGLWENSDSTQLSWKMLVWVNNLGWSLFWLFAFVIGETGVKWLGRIALAPLYLIVFLVNRMGY
jgi:hypothetical protein